MRENELAAAEGSGKKVKTDAADDDDDDRVAAAFLPARPECSMDGRRSIKPRDYLVHNICIH